MKSSQTQSKTDLFLVRLWTDEADPPVLQEGMPGAEMATRRHGRVLDMLSGESHNFDDWQELISILKGMVSQAEGQPQG